MNIIKSIWPDPTDEVRKVAPQFFHQYEAIKASALPNCLGAKRIVDSALNYREWQDLLAGYHDVAICDFIKYGLPVGYHTAQPPLTVEDNHPSADRHIATVNDFVQKELALGALLGPFQHPPFFPWTRCSPVMTRPKRESKERRVIVDLTYPEGKRVNDLTSPIPCPA